MEMFPVVFWRGVLGSCSPVCSAAGVVYIAEILTGNHATLAVVVEAAGMSSETAGKYSTLLAKELKIKRKNPVA